MKLFTQPVAWARFVVTTGVVAVLALLFAHVEVQIEGGIGWAASLPVTFRVEHHWALDWFWGGRPITGYHAFVFSFMALAIHLPIVIAWRWSWRMQARCAAALMLFWIIEDFLWFVINPDFGLAGLRPGNRGESGVAWWHPRWFLGFPVEYWLFGPTGLALMWWGCREARPAQPPRADDASATSG